MYCPNCATETAIDQKFCRSCGMSLALVSQAMSSQSLVPGISGRQPSIAADEDASEDRRSKFMRWGFVLLFAGLVFTILMGVSGDEIQKISVPLGHFVNSLAGLGAAILLAGVGLVIYAGLLPSIKAPKPPRGRAIPPPPTTINHPITSPTTASMEPVAQPLPSVAEHTTYTLEPKKEGDPISR
jgi:hypothetical protein